MYTVRCATASDSYIHNEYVPHDAGYKSILERVVSSSSSLGGRRECLRPRSFVFAEPYRSRLNALHRYLEARLAPYAAECIAATPILAVQVIPYFGRVSETVYLLRYLFGNSCYLPFIHIIIIFNIIISISLLIQYTY